MGIKHGLIFDNTNQNTLLHSGSSMQDGTVTIPKIFYFMVPPEDNPRDYSDIDVYSHVNFPQYGSALSNDPRYKFYGNASIEKLNPDSRTFKATLQYSSSQSNSTDSDGNSVTSETKPWNLKPDNIQFTYSDFEIPFTASYNNKGELWKKNPDNPEYPEPILPVTNSAGDKISMTTTVNNMNISFTYALRNFDILNTIGYKNSINAENVNILGIIIPPYCCQIKLIEPSYLTVYEDSSSTIKWQYWSINMSVLIDLDQTSIFTKVLDVGNRAIFDSVQYSDGFTQSISQNINLPASPNNLPEQICYFRKSVMMNNKPYQIGEMFYCGWSQYIALRQFMLENSNNEYSLECEQGTAMPLLSSGKLNKDALEVTSKKYQKYNHKIFRKYHSKAWNVLNIPKKGIKWN